MRVVIPHARSLHLLFSLPSFLYSSLFPIPLLYYSHHSSPSIVQMSSSMLDESTESKTFKTVKKKQSTAQRSTILSGTVHNIIVLFMIISHLHLQLQLSPSLPLHHQNPSNLSRENLQQSHFCLEEMTRNLLRIQRFSHL